MPAGLFSFWSAKKSFSPSLGKRSVSPKNRSYLPFWIREIYVFLSTPSPITNVPLSSDSRRIFCAVRVCSKLSRQYKSVIRSPSYCVHSSTGFISSASFPMFSSSIQREIKDLMSFEKERANASFTPKNTNRSVGKEADKICFGGV